MPDESRPLAELDTELDGKAVEVLRSQRVAVDPALAEQSTDVGEGGRFNAVFSRCGDNKVAGRVIAPARVMKLTDGRFRSVRGMTRSVDVNSGPSCLLELEGILVAVSTNRLKIAGSDYLEHFGLDPSQAAGFALKSRGHFRAGFDHLVRFQPPHQRRSYMRRRYREAFELLFQV